MIKSKFNYQHHTGRLVQPGDVCTTVCNQELTFSYIVLWMEKLEQFTMVPAEDFIPYVLQGTSNKKSDWFAVPSWFLANVADFQGNVWKKLLDFLPTSKANLI